MYYSDRVRAQINELEKIEHSYYGQKDLLEFWEKSLEESNEKPLLPKVSNYPYPSKNIKVDDVVYLGHDKTPIHAWFLSPKNIDKPVGCMIHFHGYTGNRGLPYHFVPYVDLGICVMSIDVRGQNGLTGDYGSYSSGSTQADACKGILNPYEYYYRLVYLDGIRAIDYAISRKEVDSEKIVVEGSSQGGAISMAVGSIDKRVKLILCDVPSNSDLKRRVEYSHGAFGSVHTYLKMHPEHAQTVFKTLSYIDIANMAKWVKAEVYASVGLEDDVCPARCYYATYNQIEAKKTITVYPYNGHEGGSSMHEQKKIEKLANWINEV